MAGEDAAEIPATIGKYVVVGRFAISGQAEVFRVVHPELRRDLVLKLANKGVDGDGRAAIVEEGRRLAGLDHPNIVRVHDLDFHGDRPYLIMEYVPGRTLSQYAREEPISAGHAAALVAEVAGAVAYAHRRGIVHQDIKPANVLVDEDGRPCLIDFGLAFQRDAWTGPCRPAEGGTFPYMAPEQARCDLDRNRSLCDIFALGGLLYFLLTGEGPFEATTLEASWDRARRCDLDDSALKRAGVPLGLGRICLKAMADAPQARFPSADALRRALVRYRLTRRAAPAVGAVGVAVGLALLVPVRGFRAHPAPPGTGPAAGSIAGAAIDPRVSVPSPTAPADLRVTRFEIPHFPRLDRDHYDPQRVGVLGRSSFAAREHDDVMVRAELSEPTYSYLIAFRPDGTDELCDPDDEGAIPRLKREPAYPPPAKGDQRYRLSEGAGLYAFALVVSREPLPSYREWKRRIGPMAWAAQPSCEPGVVWRHDGRALQPLLAENAAATRGKGARARDSGGPAARLASWLRGLPGVDLVVLEAFPVEPTAGP